MEVYAEGFENYVEALFMPGGVFSADRVKKGMEVLRFVRSIIPQNLKERIDELPNVISENVPPPKVGDNFFLISTVWRIRGGANGALRASSTTLPPSSRKKTKQMYKKLRFKLWFDIINFSFFFLSIVKLYYIKSRICGPRDRNQ